MLNGFLSPALNQCDKIIGVFDADSKAQQAFMISIWLWLQRRNLFMCHLEWRYIGLSRAPRFAAMPKSFKFSAKILFCIIFVENI
jgi:hypothetical protein